MSTNSKPSEFTLRLAYRLGRARQALPREWRSQAPQLGAWHAGFTAASHRPAVQTRVIQGTLSVPVDPTEGYRWGH